MKNTNILVVEDSLSDLELIETELDRKVHHVINAKDALIYLSQNIEPECIILDYKLPDADGDKLYEQIRESGISCPIVIATGQGDTDIAVKFFKMGAADYVSKSNLSELNEVITNITEQNKRFKLRIQRMDNKLDTMITNEMDSRE